MAMVNGFYAADSLDLEGFIHCSKKDQIKGVLERYYRDAGELLLLTIEPTKLISPLKYELAPSINEEFPHIYGPLNLDAVININGINSLSLTGIL